MSMLYNFLANVKVDQGDDPLMLRVSNFGDDRSEWLTRNRTGLTRVGD